MLQHSFSPLFLLCCFSIFSTLTRTLTSFSQLVPILVCHQPLASSGAENKRVR
jgi:hypothetical protein